MFQNRLTCKLLSAKNMAYSLPNWPWNSTIVKPTVYTHHVFTIAVASRSGFPCGRYPNHRWLIGPFSKRSLTPSENKTASSTSWSICLHGFSINCFQKADNLKRNLNHKPMLYSWFAANLNPSSTHLTLVFSSTFLKV